MFPRLIVKYRSVLIVAVHLLLIALSNYLAFWLRFDGEIPQKYLRVMLQTLPWLVLLRAAVFFAYRLNRGLWRYTGVWDLIKILSATAISTVIFYILTRVVLGIDEYPRSIYLFDAVLLIFFVGGLRLPWRIYREIKHKSLRGKRVLVFGAGDAGEMIIRDMRQHPEYKYNPVVLVDDNPSKVGQHIHGIPVVGTRNDLGKVIPRFKIEEVILAIPGSEPRTIREVLKFLEPFQIPIKTTPNLRDILDGNVTVSQIRKLAVEDLLTRMPVHLDLTPVCEMLRGKRVLVTGAGGSIGSELCRQITKMQPARLMMLERYENGLYEIAKELTGKSKHHLDPIIGDITDKQLIARLFRDQRPEVVIHAAAHKHVPMMEANPCEAVKNNVLGTRTLADAALEYGVEKFVLISTDKAVNPVGMMGVSKRVAEMVVQNMPQQDVTRFVTVRFGNVLASNGSVVPLFLEQIKRGGPVTVTHPEMKRFFMLIPEAVQLVLLAGAKASTSEIFVLQMGDQIPITELARNLIQLSGFVPDVDIPIQFTGVRPGEKLYEELISHDEIAEPGDVPELLRIQNHHFAEATFFRKTVQDLEIAAFNGDHIRVIEALQKLVPTFQPESSFEALDNRLGA